MTDVRAQIESLVTSHPVVLFMKGTRGMPQCGFSARVVELLDEYLPEYKTVNVLEDPEVRQGIKEYSSWPTIPQLYVKGEFVGGCDIVTDMGQSGELDDVLGVKRADLEAPSIEITEGALAALRQFGDGGPPAVVRLEITSSWQYGMDFDEVQPGDIVSESGGVKVVMKRSTARKANGLRIDFVKGPSGAGFKIDNPNEPPRVKMVHPEELKGWMDEGKAMRVYDVRTAEERATASVDGTIHLDEAGREGLGELDRETVLVFLCHHGMRSQRAAEHAIAMGFTKVFNLAGGIDLWSQKVDSTVPRY
ncbi:MAG: Grx4 family monothiol glutaredoxin [Myxococcota bacterium]